MVIHDYSNIPMPSYSTVPTLAATEILNAEPQIYQNDDLDDVFGSAPASPSLFTSSPSHLPDEEHIDNSGNINGNKEISDIPRLKEKHETEGYRDGVTKGKAQTVQKGFDEGYTLGAVLGLRIGRIQGLLEGLTGGLRAGGPAAVGIAGEESEGAVEWKEQSNRLQALLAKAKEELKTENVFGREYWGEDGIWKFKVPGESQEEQIDVVFDDVAGAHPLIKKWEGVVDEEIERWGIDLKIMEHEQEREQDRRGNEAIEKQAGESSKAPGAKKELSW